MDLLWLCSYGACDERVISITVSAVVGPGELDVLSVVCLGDDEI